MEPDFETKMNMDAARRIRRKGFVPSEESLLEVIASPRSPMELYWAIIALRYYGTVKSVHAIKPHAFHSKADVKIVTVHTVGQLAGASETQYFCDLLASAKYPEKGTVMWMIADVADESAVPAVIAYFEKNRSRINRQQLRNMTCLFGSIYLFRTRNVVPLAKWFLEAHISVLLSNLDEIDLIGWHTVCHRPKNEWVAELFAVAGSPVPLYVKPRPDSE